MERDFDCGRICQQLSEQAQPATAIENLKLGEPGEFNKEPGEEGPHATIVKVA